MHTHTHTRMCVCVCVYSMYAFVLGTEVVKRSRTLTGRVVSSAGVVHDFILALIGVVLRLPVRLWDQNEHPVSRVPKVRTTDTHVSLTTCPWRRLDSIYSSTLPLSHTHAHTHTHTCIHTHTHTCTHAFTHTTHTCIHTYMHTCIHTHAFTHIHTHTHTATHTHACTHTHAHTHTHTHTCIHTHTHTCTHAFTHTTHTCIHTYMHTCIHTHAFTHIHTHTHTATHTHACTHTHAHTHTHSQRIWKQLWLRICQAGSRETQVRDDLTLALQGDWKPSLGSQSDQQAKHNAKEVRWNHADHTYIGQNPTSGANKISWPLGFKTHRCIHSQPVEKTRNGPVTNVYL